MPSTCFSYSSVHFGGILPYVLNTSIINTNKRGLVTNSGTFWACGQTNAPRFRALSCPDLFQQCPCRAGLLASILSPLLSTGLPQCRPTFSGVLSQSQNHEGCLRLLVWALVRVLAAGRVDGGGWAQGVCRRQSSNREAPGVCEAARGIERRAATEKRQSL